MAQVIYKVSGALKGVLVEAETVAELRTKQNASKLLLQVNGMAASEEQLLADGDVVVATEQLKGQA